MFESEGGIITGRLGKRGRESSPEWRHGVDLEQDHEH
jgi:hypothetical protein